MPSGAVLEGRPPPQSKSSGLPGITRQRVGLPLKYLIKLSPPPLRGSLGPPTFIIEALVGTSGEGVFGYSARQSQSSPPLQFEVPRRYSLLH